MDNFDERALTWDKEPRHVERTKAVSIEIINSIPNLSRMSGFEYGCGTGLLSFNLQPHLKWITLADNSDGMLNILRQKIQKAGIVNMTPFKMDLTVDTVPDLQCDLVYTLMTMHHIADIDKVIAAFYRMLNPEGYLAIADLDEEDGSFHNREFSGHHGFNREQLARTLESRGFDNVSSKICHKDIKQSADGQVKHYPVFLMIARKR